MGMEAGEFREREETGCLERESMVWNGAEKEATAANGSISLKLSLFSLPLSQPSEPSGVRTPPLYSSLSVPFQWEETPGKARFCPTDPIVSARSLELPPRLLNEARVSNILSPTTVLEGPYLSKTAFSSTSFRSSDGWSRRDDNGTLFGSKRWGSFRKNSRDLGRGSFELLPSVGGRKGAGNSSGSRSGGDSKVTISREKKRGGLFSLSNYTSSHFLGRIYERCKKVVQWRRSAEEMEEERAINTV